jgi:RHS repeat-associated protein
MPGRHANTADYRYGLQGQEMDDEIKGEGNSLNYTFRMHDPRIGRFFAVDPLEKKFPYYSPYQFSGNKLIAHIEIEGLEEGWLYFEPNKAKSLLELSTNEDLWKKLARNVEAKFRATEVSAAFDQYLPKRLINHYTVGKGTSLTLNVSEMKAVNPHSVSIYAGVNKDKVRTEAKRFLKELNTLNLGESKEVNLNVAGQSRTHGTLGEYNIIFKGILTKDKEDDEKWSFEGTMSFEDTWDFDKKADGERREDSEIFTKIGRVYLIGEGFKINSEGIPVRQTSEDSQVDFWTNNQFSDAPSPLVEWLKEHPKIKKAIFDAVESFKE